MSQCRSCSAPIIWIKTSATGKPMPLDRDPVPDGNVVIRDGLAVVLTAEESPDTTRRFLSHFSTCPDGKAHRKRKPPP